jgi:hypothetical protein
MKQPVSLPAFAVNAAPRDHVRRAQFCGLRTQIKVSRAEEHRDLNPFRHPRFRPRQRQIIEVQAHPRGARDGCARRFPR